MQKLVVEEKRDASETNNSNVSSHKIDVLCFTIAEYDQADWFDNHSEIFHKGSMYDVIDIWSENDKIYVRCIRDNEETNLFENIAIKEGKQDYSQKSNNNSIFLLYLSKENVNYIYPFKTTLIIELIKNCYLWKDNKIYEAHLSDIPTPPPRLTQSI